MAAVIGAAVAASLSAALLAAAPHLVRHPALRASLVRHVSAWTGGTVEIAGDIQLSSLIALTVEAHGIAISGATRIEPVVSLEAQSVKAIVSLPGLLAGRVEISKVVFTSATIVLGRSLTAGTAPGDFSPDLLGAPLALMRGSPFKEVVLRHTTVRYATGEQEPFGKIVIAQARLSRKSSGAADFDCQMTDGTGRIQFGMQAGAPADASLPIALRLARDGLTASFTGALDWPARQATGQVAMTSSAVNPMTQSLTSAFMPWQMETLTGLSGDMTWSGGRLSLDNADFKSETLHAKGSLAVSLLPQRTAVEGTLAYDAIDLSPFYGPDGRIGLARLSAAVDPPPGFGLPRAGFDIRLSSEKVRAGALTGGPLAIALTRQQGRLGLDVAELGLLGGTFHGRLDYDPEAPLSVSLKMAGSRIDAASIPLGLTPPPFMTGQADVTVNIRAALDLGANAARLAEGSFIFALPSGGTVSAEGYRRLSELPGAADLAWASGGRGTLALSKLSISGVLSGNAVAADIKGESGNEWLSGAVSVDLTDSWLKGMLSLGETAADPAAGEPASPSPPRAAGQASHTFFVSGTAASPNFSAAATRNLSN